jgi:holo-[acyl-carrier protein] synthase
MLKDLPCLSIYGIGTDIIGIKRVAALYERFGQRFINKILTAKEQQFIPQQLLARINHLAKRFAAKEACAKALGTGLGHLYHFHDCEVFKNDLGQPFIHLSPQIYQRHPTLGASYLSLSDEKDYAVAFCILQNI